MRKGLVVSASIVSVLALSALSPDAQAISLPDNTSAPCSGSDDPCFKISSGVTNATTIWGNATGSGTTYGLYGQGYYGVKGQAATGSGGEGVYGVGDANGGGIGVHGVAIGAGVGVYAVAGASGYAIWGIDQAAGGYAGVFTGPIHVTGQPSCDTQTTFTYTSDARLKKNVKPLEGALDKLLQLRGVTFEWNNPEEHGNLSGMQRGFIAQEVEKALPEWVGTNNDGFKNITTRGIEAMIVESLRTLKAENDHLKDRVKVLEGNRRSLSSMFMGNVSEGLAVGMAGIGLVL